MKMAIYQTKANELYKKGKFVEFVTLIEDKLDILPLKLNSL